MEKQSKRVPIPFAVQSQILLANRHACCVCQKPRVQLHHIDGNPSNNDPANIAALCTDHHDMATMQIGLTKKLQPNQIRTYKKQWEESCRRDFRALSRARFSFFYCMYKNPPRLLAAYYSLADGERRAAVKRVRESLGEEQQSKEESSIFGLGTVPQSNALTLQALQSIEDGERYPSYLGNFKPHPADPNYSTDLSTQEAMVAYHLYDLWCQVIAQTLAEARGTTPLESLFRFRKADELNAFAGSLVSFRLAVYGKDLHLPSMWKEHSVGSLQSRKTIRRIVYRARMQLRTMYLFSDTASVNLQRTVAAGLGLFASALEITDEEKKGNTEIELTIVPLLIGTGGQIIDL